MNSTRQTQSFIGAMVLAAIASVGFAGFESHTVHLYHALAVLALAAATSRMKVKLPGINGNMSVNLPFLLTAVINLSAAEAVGIACVSTVVQCWPRRQARFKPEQMVFNVGMMAFASSMASLMSHADGARGPGWASGTVGLILGAVTLLLGQTAPVAAIISLSEGGPMRQLWQQMVHLSFPYYVVSAGVASMMQTVTHLMGWEVALAALAVMYGIHRSYRLYFGRAAQAPHSAQLVRAAGAGF